MPVSSNSNRPLTSRVNAALEKNLAAYVAAASAAGVALLAAQPAAAKVVYTPTNTVITAPTAIDLNHDGVADFTLEFTEGIGHSFWLMVLPQVTGNAVRGNNGAAAAGFLGVPVGPGEKFTTNSYYGKGVFMAGFFQYSFQSNFFGPFANATNRYLGFKFLIDGQVHYGWARMTVTNALHNVVLTGYAYETTPNVNIVEGHISGASASNLAPTDLAAPVQPEATLGMLARGDRGLAIWRREDGQTRDNQNQQS